ncbi:RNA 2',3'-cyclic phosphodiesterase [Allobranchiibius sp. GilTou38]|uniref:RNA 2',3'-cyclic phosphodiesterase n=1 Tax=Allobranchiibius sp. GilTou38 TaxID=2815210 RepID=UPI001AA194FE|nr:RNA 2',3'-cyclic phosphodiesterase [Allobranchiibius sp. GilTou38]MBO1766972.1 RNA 2',3'-cyclic phosphodiesterase [Allobranchiibius sp. GilTou38]
MPRVFVALRPPQEEVARLDDFLDVRRDAAPFSWTDAEQFHLTLAFLPDVPEHRLDDLVEAVAAAAGRRDRFDLCLGGGGAFPDPARAKVMWVGLRTDEHADQELQALAAGVRGSAAHSGAQVDGQRFRPHVTVARCGRPTPLDRWVRLLDGYSGAFWSAEEVEVIASYLGEGPHGRARHEVLARLPLGDLGPSPSL